MIGIIMFRINLQGRYYYSCFRAVKWFAESHVISQQQSKDKFTTLITKSLPKF